MECGAIRSIIRVKYSLSPTPYDTKNGSSSATVKQAELLPFV